MRAAPHASHSWRSHASHAGSTGCTPPSPCTGSMITAPAFLPPALTARSVAARSPSGTISTPGTSGSKGRRYSGRSVAASDANRRPWNPPLNATIPGFPDHLRANLKAASFASAPELQKNTWSAHELLGEALTRLRPVEVGHMDQSRREGPLDRPADHGMIVAQGVDADPGDEVEVAYAVLGDELGAVAARKHRADASVHAEQCRSGSGSGGHAGCAATASTRVPADDRSSRVRSPMRTARAPAARADLAARSFAAMPSRATPAAIRLSISVAAISGWVTPPTTTPGTSETSSSSAAARAPATAAAA